jgi:serine/threonine protein kinase
MAGQLTNKELDHYQLKGVVEKNSLAEVYSAQDKKLNRPVGVHILHSDLAPLGEWSNWAQDAIQVSEQLSHPGLLFIRDYGHTKAHFYWVTTPLLRTGLSQAKANLQLSPACQLVYQVAGTVEYLHQQGIYLRDLRPRTIGIQPARMADGVPFHPILTDVGLIPLAQSALAIYQPLLEKLKDWPERLAYLAPEYLSGQPPDARCDIYALGMLLHQLALGRLPVDFKTLDEAVQFHTTKTRPTPRELKPGLPQEIEVIIQSALAGPADRFSAVSEFREQLGSYLALVVPHWQNRAFFASRPGQAAGQIWVRYLDQEPWPVEIPPNGVLRVGRDPDKDLSLDSAKISRYHVDIKFDGARYYLTDRGSTNGTILVGRKLPPEKQVRWPPDQVVTLGQSGYSLLLTPKVNLQAGAAGIPASTDLTLVLESDEFKKTADGQRRLTLKPGDRKNLSVKITSREKGRQLSLVVEGIEWTWRGTLPPIVPVAANRFERVILPLTPPEGAESPPGDYLLTVKAEDKNDPSVVAADRCILTIEPDYEFESWLDNELVAPAVLIGNDITAVLNIENKGNVDQIFEITFNPNSGLERLKDKEVKVDKGSPPKPVEIKPSRFPFGLRPYNEVSVEVKSQESDETKSLKLRSANPRSVFWGTIALVIAMMMCGTVAVAQVISRISTPTETATAVASVIATKPAPTATEENPTEEATTPAENEATASAKSTEQAAIAIAVGNATAIAAAAEATAQATPPPSPSATPVPPTTTPTPVTPTPTPTLPPTQLSFGQQPPLSVIPSTPIAISITVNIADKDNNVVSDTTNAVLLELVYPNNNQTAVLASRSAVDGVATFSGLVIDAEPQNNYQLRATSAGLTEARSNLFNIIPPPPKPTSLVFTRPPTDTERYVPILVEVEIRDQFGTKVPGASNVVNFSITGANGQQSESVVAVDGVAVSAVNTDGLSPGQYVMTASSSGLTPTTSAAFAITPPKPSMLTFDTQPPKNIVVGQQFAVAVAIRDVKGAVIPTEKTEVRLSLPETIFILAGAPPQVPNQGVAAFSNLRILYPGEGRPNLLVAPVLYRLRAQAGDLVKDSNEFTITPPNTPPRVNAGPDQTGTLEQTISLTGTVEDDGLPNPPGTFTVGWSQVSGPGTVTFGNMNAANTTATFSAPGSYNLRLTANDGDLSGSDEVMVTVEVPLKADFTADMTSGDAPLTVRFTDMSTGNPTSWSWDFGDGSTSTDRNPTHTYECFGVEAKAISRSYDVSLTVQKGLDSDTENKAEYIRTQLSSACF